MLLDLDGTLLDHAGSSRRALARWLADQGLTPPDGFGEEWLAAEQRHYPAWRVGEISFAEQRRRRLRDVLPLLGLPVGDDAALDITSTAPASSRAPSWRPPVC